VSQTYLYTVSQKGVVSKHHEFSNSWRGAMWVWMRLREEYFPDHIFHQEYRYDDPRTIEACKWVMKYEDIWSLSDDSRLIKQEKIVLGSTYDNVIVKKENLDELIEAFKFFVNKYKKDNPPNASSLLEQMEVIEKLKKKKNLLGICWNQTSVNCDAWNGYTKKGEWRQYNLNKDKGHWFLFDDIK
jgi:hypothetical protein